MIRPSANHVAQIRPRRQDHNTEPNQVFSLNREQMFTTDVPTEGRVPIPTYITKHESGQMATMMDPITTTNFRFAKIRRDYISDAQRYCDQPYIFLFCNVRDEVSLDEWLAHHLNLGFSRIVVYDHLSKIPVRHQLQASNEKLQKACGKDWFRRVDIQSYTKEVNTRMEKSGGIKNELMKFAIGTAQRARADWMMYLDVDEYLYLDRWDTIQQMMYYYAHADVVCLNWLMFGTSFHDEQPEGSIVTSFCQCEGELDSHIKQITRPQQVIGCTSPHYYFFGKQYILCMDVLGNMCDPQTPYQKRPVELTRDSLDTNVPAFIAHYFVQSVQEFTHRKGRVMDNGMKPKMTPPKNTKERKMIHAMHNMVTFRKMADKYGPVLGEFGCKGWEVMLDRLRELSVVNPKFPYGIIHSTDQNNYHFLYYNESRLGIPSTESFSFVIPQPHSPVDGGEKNNIDGTETDSKPTTEDDDNAYEDIQSFLDAARGQLISQQQQQTTTHEEDELERILRKRYEQKMKDEVEQKKKNEPSEGHVEGMKRVLIHIRKGGGVSSSSSSTTS